MSSISYWITSQSNVSPRVVVNNSVYLFQYPCLNSNSECTFYHLRIPQGLYLFEAWGARSGYDYFNNDKCGKGAYIAGRIRLLSPKTFLLYIGGVGDNGVKMEKVNGGYNGGGNAGEYGGGGGGATDIRLDESLKSRIFVAAGAGGGEKVSTGHGGGLTGIQGQSTKCENYVLSLSSEPGTQTQGGISGEYDNEKPSENGGFGYGGEGYCGSDGGSGGGGGYYGGGATCFTCSASGGSSFISGHPNCVAVEYDDEIKPTSPPSNIHYSGIYFTNTNMINGSQQMPLPSVNKDLFDNGNEDYGAFRITILDTCVQTCKNNSFPNIKLFILVFILL